MGKEPRRVQELCVDQNFLEVVCVGLVTCVEVGLAKGSFYFGQFRLRPSAT